MCIGAGCDRASARVQGQESPYSGEAQLPGHAGALCSAPRAGLHCPQHTRPATGTYCLSYTYSAISDYNLL